MSYPGWAGVALQGLLKASGRSVLGFSQGARSRGCVAAWSLLRLRIAAICGFCGSSHISRDQCLSLVSDWGLMGSMVVLGANLGVLLR
jgi:hypothetical protein